MTKENKTYDISYKIFRLNEDATIEEALRWVKSAEVESKWNRNHGTITIDNVCNCGGFKAYYDAIANNRDLDGTKIYKNSSRDFKMRRFKNQKVRYYVIREEKFGNEYDEFLDQYAYARLVNQILDLTENNWVIKTDCYNINIK